MIGASTIPSSLMLRLKNELKVKHVLAGLGLTESSAAGVCTQMEDAAKNPKYAYESVGRPFAFVILIQIFFYVF